MSMRRTPAAKLAGWEGPFYQDVLNRLAEAVEACQQTLDGATLRQLGLRMHGFRWCKQLPRAADGYTWYWCLAFRTGLWKQVLVAIPWTQDYDRRDGTSLDRSPAIYLKGRVTGAKVDAVVTDLAKQVQALGQ